MLSGAAPTFSLSLDCEGLWGMADQPHLLESGAISRNSLSSAYEFLIRVLQANGVRATAAFVSCFAVGFDGVMAHSNLLEEMGCHAPSWFSSILRVLRSGQSDGWDGSDLYRRMSAAGFEIGWHGATHHSLGERTSPRLIALEAELASRLFRELGANPTTIIFPRNDIGHLDQLLEYGFDTYRDALNRNLMRRAMTIACEYNVLQRCPTQRIYRRDGWYVSPAGCFLNWPLGLRQLVPVSVTIMRWKSMLRSAITQGGYLHMWFHPHNLITAPAMKLAFEEVIGYVGQLVKAGDLINPTMTEANRLYEAGLHAT
jgi:hypothetical protein